MSTPAIKTAITKHANRLRLTWDILGGIYAGFPEAAGRSGSSLSLDATRALSGVDRHLSIGVPWGIVIAPKIDGPGIWNQSCIGG